MIFSLNHFHPLKFKIKHIQSGFHEASHVFDIKNAPFGRIGLLGLCPKPPDLDFKGIPKF